MPSARMHRVTTRRQSLRALRCPLEPELLVAEFAGELPPEVALAVREHVAVCETCGARSRSLRAPYELLSSLGQAPVTNVPDLRDTIRERVRSFTVARRVLRFTARLGSGGTLAVTGLLGLVVLVAFVAIVFILPLQGAAARSQNGVKRPVAAGASGMLYAETNKVFLVPDRAGHSWPVAEVVGVSQQNGAIQQSLPMTSATPRIAADQLPFAVVVQGKIIVELTAANDAHQQALVIIDATSGQVGAIVPITLPGGQALPSDLHARALVVAADGTHAYVGLDQAQVQPGSIRALTIDLVRGTVDRAITPGFTSDVPLPPPPGSLPASAFPSVVPHLNAAEYRATPGLGGALALSPDGLWLFDLVQLDDAHGPQYVVLQRINTQNGMLAQQLGLQGDFRFARLTSNTATIQPQVYLVTGSPSATCYVIDATVTGPTLAGRIPLGGPIAPETLRFSGSLSVSAAADGTHLYITQDATSTDNQVTGHDLWIVDTLSMNISAHRSDILQAGAVLANVAPAPLTAQGKPGQQTTFLLRDGAVVLVAADLNATAQSWLRLSDGRPVIALLATSA